MKKIKKSELSQYNHMLVTKKLEKQSALMFSYLMALMKKDLLKALKKNKLAKSDDPADKLESGWSGNVNRVEININEHISPVVDKYLKALRWLMYGNYAGKEAKEIAESLGLTKKAIPGIIPSVYLTAIDASKEHHEILLGEESPGMPKSLLRHTMKKIMERSKKFFIQSLNQMKLNIINVLEKQIDDKNYQNMSKIHKEAHDLLPKYDPAIAMMEASEAVSSVLSLGKVSKEIDYINRKNSVSWSRMVNSEANLATATATHQSMMEIHGNKDDDVKVVFMAFEDEKTCSFCDDASRDKNGNFKFYKMSDFRPSGYNYSKKKSEWVLTIPPTHINCRCYLIYVPRGFKVDKDGTIFKE